MRVGEVPGYMITDSTQSIDANTMPMIRSGWTRVRQSVSFVFHTEEDVGHLAILNDDNLVCGQVNGRADAQTGIVPARSRCHVRPKPARSRPPPNPPSSQSMAHPIPTYAQPHGTLAPGQTISVNKYTVQVERYLSQGELRSLSCDRPFRNVTAHQPRPNYRWFCSRLSRTDLGASLWDNASCPQEDRCLERFDVDRREEGG